MPPAVDMQHTVEFAGVNSVGSGLGRRPGAVCGTRVYVIWLLVSVKQAHLISNLRDGFRVLFHFAGVRRGKAYPTNREKAAISISSSTRETRHSMAITLHM